MRGQCSQNTRHCTLQQKCYTSHYTQQKHYTSHTNYTAYTAQKHYSTPSWYVCDTSVLTKREREIIGPRQLASKEEEEMATTHAATRGDNQICIQHLFLILSSSSGDVLLHNIYIQQQQQQPEPITGVASLTGESVAIRSSSSLQILSHGRDDDDGCDHIWC